MRAWSADQLDHQLTQRMLWFLLSTCISFAQEPACKRGGCISTAHRNTSRDVSCLWLDLYLQQLVRLGPLLGFFAAERAMEPEYSASKETGLVDVVVVIAG